MEVREMLPSDLPEIIEVVSAFRKEHGELAKTEIPKFNALPKAKFFVCVIDSRVVGVLGYIPDLKEAPGIYWAEWGYVHPDYQRRGVATRLWDTVEADLKANGCRKIYLDIGNEDDHAVAIRIYKDRGYVNEGMLLDFWGDGENMVVYAKRLA